MRALDRVVANVQRDISASIAEAGASIFVSELPTLYVFPRELAPLFQNLLSNAIKFRHAERPLVIHISAQEQQNAWQITVSDNGIGMEDQHLKKIFDIFHRLHSRSEYAGTGIGLAVCKKAVELHRGRIWAESEVGVGTRFCFTISKGLDAML